MDQIAQNNIQWFRGKGVLTARLKEPTIRKGRKEGEKEREKERDRDRDGDRETERERRRETGIGAREQRNMTKSYV